MKHHFMVPSNFNLSCDLEHVSHPPCGWRCRSHPQACRLTWPLLLRTPPEASPASPSPSGNASEPWAPLRTIPDKRAVWGRLAACTGPAVPWATVARDCHKRVDQPHCPTTTLASWHALAAARRDIRARTRLRQKARTDVSQLHRLEHSPDGSEHSSTTVRMAPNTAMATSRNGCLQLPTPTLSKTHPGAPLNQASCQDNTTFARALARHASSAMRWTREQRAIHSPLDMTTNPNTSVMRACACMHA